MSNVYEKKDCISSTGLPFASGLKFKIMGCYFKNKRIKIFFKEALDGH